MLKKAILIVILSLLRYMAFADVFVVTNNADSGPGTLREALIQAAANDSTQTDYINFNLANLTEAGRTITLTSQLPDVSSNLVIDGSTQPGAKFGRSNAKVMLAFQVPQVRTLSGLRIVNRHNVAVYGLYINLLTNISVSNIGYFQEYSGIDLRNNKNIQIGALGKGNVVCGFYYPISTNKPPHYGNFPFENLIIKDNIFGIAADGETLSDNETSPVHLSYVIGDITIGGIIGEGNLFPQGISISQQNTVNSNAPEDLFASLSANFTIKNNVVGTDLNQRIIIAKLHAINMTSSTGAKSSFYIEDNLLAAKNGYNIYAVGMANPIYILRNHFNTDKTLQNDLKGAHIGVFIYYCPQVFLGSIDPDDANYITQCQPVSVWPRSRIAIHKNSFFCTNSSTPMHFSGGTLFYPVVDILSASSTNITGTATPNAVVELFYSDVCGTCSPQSYFASVTAGADGKWQHSSFMSGKVIASATLNNSTSEFTRARIDINNMRAIDACGGQGSITGAIVRSAQSIKWLNEAGTVVGTNADLFNVPAGRYKLVVDNGVCSDETEYYPILNAGVGLNATNVQVKKASCNQADGAITGITSNVTGAEVFKWLNEAGAIVGNNINLTGVPAGGYRLTISATGNPCPETYGPVIISNTTGPSINQANALIQSTNCGQTTGSITGVTATGTGTLKYTWKNAVQQIVATTADLTNRAAGQYRLEVTDDTQCGAVYTTVLIIPETNGITLTDANVSITPSSCNTNNGSVKGITLTGATAHKWVNAGNVTVATTVDLLNAPSGVYTFTASNRFGCVQSRNYTVSQQTLTQYPAYVELITPSCSGQSNGSVSFTPDSKVKTQRWQNSLGTALGTSTAIANVPAGEYQLFLTDANGCESLYKSYNVPVIRPIQITLNSAVITNDVCGTKKGSIKNVQATGGAGNTYSYEWTDSNNAIIATTADVANLAGGTYAIRVYEANNCDQGRATYTVLNESNPPSAPIAPDVAICSSGPVVVAVTNPEAGYQYKLYDTPLSTAIIAVQSNGKFTVNVSSPRDYYISRSFGTCESPRVKVHVSLSISVLNIANTFTPNGDGINDLWLIPGMQNNTAVLVQVFNRSGVKVFESKGYATPFDGRSSGKPLPIGTYYYIINPGQGCKLFTGTLTVIR